MDVNADKIRELADLAIEKNLAELTVSEGDKSVTIKLPLPAAAEFGPQPMVYTPPPPAPVAEIPAKSSADDAGAAPDSNLLQITAPMVGTFYSAPSPESPTFVSLGQSVSKGQVLCIIEAMKMMNELESEVSGKVVKILVENAQPVEFGQVLMLVEPG